VAINVVHAWLTDSCHVVWACCHTHCAQSFVHVIDGVLLPAGALPGLRGTDAAAGSTRDACHMSLWLTWSFLTMLAWFSLPL
jgi:hypothetical protein